MITMKKLQEQIKNLKNKIKIIKEIKENDAEIIARVILYKYNINEDYEEKKQNLINKGFEYKKTKKTTLFPNEYEIWEKTIGTQLI